MHPALYILVAIAAAGLPSQTFAAGPTSAQRRLHVEQQQDALNLQLQQSAAARRHALTPSDARRLHRLELRQRIEQRQLELEQGQRARELPRGVRERESDALRDAQHAAFAQERALQMQRFELDRQRELQAMRRQPLQPPLGAPPADLR